jgi:hypothetical protein
METESQPYKPDVQGTPYCTATRGYSHLDWLWGATYGLAAIDAAHAEEWLALAAFAAGAAAHGMSARYGRQQVRACRGARDAYESWHRDRLELNRESDAEAVPISPTVPAGWLKLPPTLP